MSEPPCCPNRPETLRELRERLDKRHSEMTNTLDCPFMAEWPRISKALEEIDALLDERDRLKAALEAHREALREALTLVRYSPPAQYDCGHNAQIDRIAAVLDKKP